MMPAAIEVYIWDQYVGGVAAQPRTGYYVFGYSPESLKNNSELAPLSMPNSGLQKTFTFPNLSEATYHRLPPMLADALPDDFGNAAIDAWMKQAGMDKRKVTVLDRLAYMGKRGMGALEFRPSQGAHRDGAKPLAMRTLVEEARLLIQGDFRKGNEAKPALGDIVRVGASAGGAHAKAIVAWNPATQEVRSGQFDAGPGFEHWLLKLDGVGSCTDLGTADDYGRIEYAYAKMAGAAGIQMSPTRLLEENGRAHFMTRRFDRDVVNGKTVKHHTQTLCALDQRDFRQRAIHSYGNYFEEIVRMDMGDEAIDQAFRRMAFNVMARNCDDHTKNLSFLLKEGEPWVLAPAYDVTHAYNPHGESTRQHLMSVNRKFDDITRDDLLQEAERYGVRRPQSLLADVS